LILFISLCNNLLVYSKGEFANLLFFIRTRILVLTQLYPRVQTEMWNMVSLKRGAGVCFKSANASTIR